ncbi:DUF1642 domain-containing protein [Streptococcus pluranimalium]
MVVKSQVLDIITQIDEPQKVVVPQSVAEWYEEHKGSLEYNLYLYQMSIYDEEVEKDNFYYWMQKSNNPIRTLVNMHQFGYTIKKEKLYTVKLKANDQVLSKHFGTIAFVHSSIALSQSYIQFSKSELEQAGFGWVFDCDGVKVVE